MLKILYNLKEIMHSKEKLPQRNLHLQMGHDTIFPRYLQMKVSTEGFKST